MAAAVIGPNHRALLISLKLAFCTVADKSAPPSRRRRAKRRTALQSPLDARRRFAQARIGSQSLGEFPLEVVPTDCERYGRAESYGRDGLAGSVRRGHRPALLMTLATCELQRDFSRACGARFTDLAAKRE